MEPVRRAGSRAKRYNTASGGLPGTNGLGGAGGQTGSPGTNYAANATTTGIAALNLANGTGGNATNWSGGGGGGYGGGGGGGGGSNGDGAGGGGGGSYGTTIIAGNGSTPGNTGDPAYVANAGQGGIGAANGYDGLVTVSWESGVPSKLISPTRLANGSFQFSFTNLVQASFTVQVSTNLAATNGWTRAQFGHGSCVRTVPVHGSAGNELPKAFLQGKFALKTAERRDWMLCKPWGTC